MSTNKMKAAQISKPGGDFEVVERTIPEPGPQEVRVKVAACGICHSDVLVKDGLWPGLQYPRVPGHEIAGHIDALGGDVVGWEQGQRVGVGWHGDIVLSAINVGAATSPCALIVRSPVLISMADMPNT